MTEIVHIGSCSGCRRRSRLSNGACPSCTSRFGARAGLIMERIRSDPDFAVLCYGKCSDQVKPVFVQMFGLPAGCEAV